jgi:hypothetical protein
MVKIGTTNKPTIISKGGTHYIQCNGRTHVVLPYDGYTRIDGPCKGAGDSRHHDDYLTMMLAADRLMTGLTQDHADAAQRALDLFEETIGCPTGGKCVDAEAEVCNRCQGA